MAEHPSALKRQRQAEKRRARYRDRQSHILDLTKNLIAAPSKSEALKVLQAAQSQLAKFAQKGKMHRKTASRRIANLFKAVSKKS